MFQELGSRPAFARRSGWGFKAILTASIGLLVLRALPARAQGGMSVSEPASRPGSMSRLYFDGHKALSRGDVVEAERDFREAIRRMANESVAMGDDCQAQAYEGLGAVYLQKGQYQDAVQTLEKAAGLNPTQVITQTLLGRSYYELHQNSKAVAALETALRLKPRDPEATLYLGKAQGELGDYQAASDTLSKLAESKPDPRVIDALSTAYMQRTMQLITSEGKLAPHSFESLQIAALGAQTRGDYKGAADYYRQALSVKPDAIGLHYALGNALVALGQRDEAAAEYKKETELNPNDSAALWKFGALALHHDPREARDYLERSLRLDPHRVGAVLDYGNALALNGETQKAVEQYRRVIGMDPGRASVHYLLAIAYRNLGREAEAKTELAQYEALSKQQSERKQQQIHGGLKTSSGDTPASGELDSDSAPAPQASGSGSGPRPPADHP